MSDTGTGRDDLEGAVGDYGDLLTTNPRLYCEHCERFVYATTPEQTARTHYFLECGCCIASPDDRPDSWTTVNNLVTDGGDRYVDSGTEQ